MRKFISMLMVAMMIALVVPMEGFAFKKHVPTSANPDRWCDDCGGGGHCRKCGPSYVSGAKTGQVFCPRCGGNGYINSSKCGECGATGYVNCKSCKGTGTCATCKGTGKVPDPPRNNSGRATKAKN